MKPLHLTGLAVLFTLIAGCAGSLPDAPQEREGRPDSLDVTDSFVLPEDLAVTRWAASPQVYNPTSIDVDARGRIWVVEAVNYRDFNNPPEARKSRRGERIVILEDTDGDGVSDSSKVFVQDEDLVSPLGIAVLGDKVIVSSSPSLYVYTDEDGDDRPDSKEVLLTGFGGLDHDHGLHAVTAGPDGRLYFNTGNAGPHIVTDKSGWTLRAGSMYAGGTPYNRHNEAGLVSDDGRVWVGGLQLRMNPDGTGLDVMAHNYRNPYELAVDSYGSLWTNDNDDEVVTCRTSWVMEGGNAGFFSADGTRSWRADRRPGQGIFTAHWHQEDPGVMPAGDRTGAGAPTGITRYEGDELGAQYRGILLSADAGRNVIFGYQPEPSGAGYAMEHHRFLSSVAESTAGYVWNEVKQDERRWFRPSDVAVGTDGAIYVADWYDPIVGGHQMRDSVGYGRIYRIAPADRDLRTPRIDLATTEGQLEALKSPAANVRYLGFERLREQGEAVIDDVEALLEAENPYHRARAVWLLAQLGPEGVNIVEDVLHSNADAQLRAAAFRALRQVQQKPAVLRHARQLAADEEPVLRREVALFLRDVPLSESRQMMVDLARRYDGEDRWMLEALGLAAEGEEAATYALLEAKLGSADPTSWDARWADLVWRLHPAGAVDALQVRAASEKLSWAAKKKAMVALGFISDRRAVEAMEQLASSRDPQVAERAQWWLDYRRTNDWRPFLEAETPADEAAPHMQMLRLREKVLDDSVPMGARTEAARAMAADPAGGRILVVLAAENRLPAALREAAAGPLSENPNRTVRVLAAAYVPRTDAPEPLDTDTAVALQGTSRRGRMLFFSSCASCHRAGGEGHRVGPDLGQAGSRFSRDELITAIVRPSAGIAHGFQPWQITLQDGTVHVGFVLADGDTVVLKDALGRRRVLEADRIAGRTPLEVSLMPAPAELQLDARDVADIAAFLQEGE